MTIANMNKINNVKEIEGKFTCLEEKFCANRPMGTPAMITRVSGQRVYYRELPYLPGGWNAKTNRHTFSTIPAAHEEYCSVSKIKYIADTAEEAIAIFTESLNVEEKIKAYNQKVIRAFHVAVERGDFNGGKDSSAGKNSSQAEKVVLKAISDILEVKISDIGMENSLVHLGADDLDHVQIVMSIEDDLSVEFGDEELEAADTVGKLIALAEKYRQ